MGGLAGFLWFGVWPLVVVAAGLGGFVPLLVVRRRRARRLAAFEEQFPEAIDLVARALRAGHAFTTGLGIAADEMPAPVGMEFKRVYDQQNFGMSMPEALRTMASRVPVLDARFFVTAVLTQRESGGNLAEVLDNLSSVMRDRFKVRTADPRDLDPRADQRLGAVDGAARPGGVHVLAPARPCCGS